ncbi:MAG: amino-acid N-acetyltransferase [Verrucomicrobiales bacterium]|nr:amino-acid N-acetyltransferase [Verrucomicrobiales bacterium]
MKPTDLRGILQYIPRFRDQTFVISADGGVVSDVNFTNLLLDIAVLRSLNIRVVLVHGAGAQILQLAEERSLKPSNLDGTGVTDGTTLELAMTASNRLTHEILEGLSISDQRAATANAITAHPKGIINGVDQQHTGRVERVDVSMIKTLLSEGIIPVIPPLGFDGEGNTFRVNSDAVALAVSEALSPIKLIFITSAEGLHIRGQLIRQILASDLEKALAEPNYIEPSFYSKARHAATACTKGVQRVHLIDGRVAEGLLAEVFSNEGIGTLIYANEYQQIRPANKKDSPNILKLTREAMNNDELVSRSRENIDKNIGDYFIYDIDNNPVACVAMKEYPGENTAELMHLYVSPSHSNQGIGQKLVQYTVDKAAERKQKKLVTLSTQAFTYFKTKADFDEGSSSDLPTSRREEYERNGRNSRILIKHLTL